MFKPRIKDHPYDLDVWAFELNYSEKMREKWAQECIEKCGVCPESKIDPGNCEIFEAAHRREASE